MKKTATLLLMISSFLMGTVQAQETAFIDVSGSGEIQVMPDYVELKITISATEPEVAVAKDKVDEAFDFLSQTAKKSGIDKKDIESAYITNRPVWSHIRDNKRQITGYAVNRPVTVTIRDLSHYSAFLENILVDPRYQISNTQLKFNDKETLASKARRLALLNAREKAEDMAAVLGQNISGVLQIKESGDNLPYPRVMQTGLRLESGSSDRGSEMQIQEQDITAQVQVRFAITEK